jgi:hypothetical protein
MSLLTVGATFEGFVNLAGQTLGYRLVFTEVTGGNFTNQNELHATQDLNQLLENSTGNGTFSEIESDRYSLDWTDGSTNFTGLLDMTTLSISGNVTQIAGDMAGQTGGFTVMFRN